jgi:hypothetical protein
VLAGEEPVAAAGDHYAAMPDEHELRGYVIQGRSPVCCLPYRRVLPYRMALSSSPRLTLTWSPSSMLASEATGRARSTGTAGR